MLEPHVMANYKLVDLKGDDFNEKSEIDSHYKILKVSKLLY